MLGTERGFTHHGHRRHSRRFGACMPFRRHFLSREECVARLEEYLQALRDEAKGVEERIAELKETE